MSDLSDSEFIEAVRQVSAQQYSRTLGDIELLGRGLTLWERTFVVAMRKKLKACGFITENQGQHIEQIYKDRVLNVKPLS